MTYPVALAVMVGVGLGVALYYLFADSTPHGHHGQQGPNYSEPRDGPRNSWASGDNDARRRGRNRWRPEDNNECAICMDHMSRGPEVRELQCGHRYHGNCISKWLEAQRSCPLCRQMTA